MSSEGGTGENRSYVTHLNFRVGPIFYAIFSNIWEKISSYSPKISKKKLVTPLDKIRSALTVDLFFLYKKVLDLMKKDHKTTRHIFSV